MKHFLDAKEAVPPSLPVPTTHCTAVPPGELTTYAASAGSVPQAAETEKPFVFV